MREKAFTLVELLVVIAVIGILASITMVSLNSSRSKAKDVRVLVNVRQMRSIFESDYLGSAYADLEVRGDGSQIASLNSSAPSGSELVQLFKDIAGQNSNANIAEIAGENVDIFTDGVSVQIGPTPPGSIAGAFDTGLVIFTTNTAGPVIDYAIYASTTAGYVCLDSIGNVKKAGEGTAFTGILTSVPTSGGRVICQ